LGHGLFEATLHLWTNIEAKIKGLPVGHRQLPDPVCADSNQPIWHVGARWLEYKLHRLSTSCTLIGDYLVLDGGEQLAWKRPNRSGRESPVPAKSVFYNRGVSMVIVL